MRSAALLLLLTGCSTLVPMQTASVVERQTWRVGGQLSAATLCNVSDITECNQFPDGVPLPEVRANVRRGVFAATDVGASVQLQSTLLSPEHPFQGGLTLDIKRELLRLPGAQDRAHVISAGLLAGGAVAGRISLAPWITVQAGVPVFYGYQAQAYEIVAGVSIARTVVFQDVGGSQNLATLHDVNLGATLGYYRRAPSHWSVGLSYLTQTRSFQAGALQLQFGLFWDFVDAK